MKVLLMKLFGKMLLGFLLVLCGLLSVISQEVLSPSLSPLPSEILNQCSPVDMEAMREFVKSVNGSYTLDWREDKNCCQWEGVKCQFNSTGRVTRIWIPEKGLVGTLPNSFVQLDHLKELNLSYNLITGEIPGRLFHLRFLEILDLSFNNFSSIPPNVTHTPLASMRSMNLSSNALEGMFPQFSFSENLSYLNVSNNSFSGNIPVDICKNSSSVVFLDFSVNKLSGHLKLGLGDCKMLEEFYAGYNTLSGPLPNDLYGIVPLRKISLAYNRISGNLSSAIGNLSNLTALSLVGNSMTGILPEELSKLENLEELVLQSNRFQGSIPSVLSQCKRLRIFNLKNNTFSGEVRVNFTGLPDLVYLDLASNHLNGSVPPTLSSCIKLQSISLARNRFTGELPVGIGALQDLSFFSVSNNSLTNITSAMMELQRCGSLNTLILSKNFRDGEPMPTVINGFPELRTLSLGNCALHGEVPEWLRHCKYLQVLDISWNKLSGGIPVWLNSLKFLFYVDMSNNTLSGTLPMELMLLPSFGSRQKPPQVNQNSFEPPLFVKLNKSVSGLQYNQLTSLPPALYLSRNNLTGTLIPEIGLMQMLHILDLSYNNFTGIIPATISNLTNLESLDLSNNDLVGTIPPALKELTFLAKFDVANNYLEGPIPSGHQFDTFPKSSFEGNLNLCGAPLTHNCSSSRMRPVPTFFPEKKSGRLDRNTILGITASVAVGMAFFLAAILWGLSRKHSSAKRFDYESDSDMSNRSSDATSNLVVLFQNHNCKNLVLSDILKATGNFDQANIIGCGGFGLVYKAILDDGSKIAIKRLTGDCGQMEREFKAEVEALSRAQHRNLVSLQGYCKYGSDRLLIYSYMENSSLDYWLHEKLEGGSVLDWPLRLKVAQGACKGLAYLHRSCDPHIVHRDIKSSNILLDDGFEAHLADFGLSRLIMPSDTHVTTELVGTLGYIPPEYGQAWQATRKGDVYSFGVVLLELLTRKRPVEVCKPAGCRDLVAWVKKMKSCGTPQEIFDPLLQNKVYEEQMIQVLDIACMCLNQNPLKRPDIQVIASWLDKVGADNQQFKVFPLLEELSD